MIRTIAALALFFVLGVSGHAALAKSPLRCGQLDYIFEQVLMLRDGGFPRSEVEAQLKDFHASQPENLKWIPLMSSLAFSEATRHKSGAELRAFLQQECEKRAY